MIQRFSASVFALLLSSGVALAQVGYRRSDGISAVVYLGTDVPHIYEFRLERDGWHPADLTQLTGAPLPASDGQGVPAPYVRSDGINAVVYRGNDNNIYELYLRDGWHVGYLSQLTGAPPALMNPAPYVRSDGINAVTYVGWDGHIYELRLDWDGWHPADLTQRTGAPLAASAPAPYAGMNGISRVVYSGLADGWGYAYHLYELRLE